MPPASSLPVITERTYAVVKDLMARDGLDSTDGHEVARYVEQLIARERFFRTVEGIRARTANLPAAQLQQLIDDAVNEVELPHRGAPARADGARQ